MTTTDDEFQYSIGPREDRKVNAYAFDGSSLAHDFPIISAYNHSLLSTKMKYSVVKLAYP